MSTIIAEILNRIPPMTQELSYIFWITCIIIGIACIITYLWGKLNPSPPSTVINNIQLTNNVTIIVPPSP